jgi:hypothetical protein
MWLPVVVWLNHPSRGAFPSEITAASGALLTSVVFMLGMAQRSYQSALDAVVKELSERDRALCKAASADSEPWLAPARRERVGIDLVAAVAGFTPAEHRWRSWRLSREQTLNWRLFDLERRVRDEVSAALETEHPRPDRAEGEPVPEIEELVAAVIDDGSVDHLPAASRDECIRLLASRQQARQELGSLREASVNVELKALQRVQVTGAFELGETGRFRSPVAVEFEETLGSYVRPLDMASVLGGATVSLVAVGLAYAGVADGWLRSPALWGSVTLTAVTIIYIAVMRRSLREAGRIAGRRLRRLVIPAMFRAEILLHDAFVERSMSRGEPRDRLLQELSCLVGAEDVPLRLRLLGQMHLYRAREAAQAAERARVLHDLGNRASGTSRDDDVDTLECQRAERDMHNELDLAKSLLTRAVVRADDARKPGEGQHDSHPDDDPVALLALAAVMEMRQETPSRDDPDPRVKNLIVRAYLRTQQDRQTLSSRTIDPGAGLEMRQEILAHRWLWPREVGPLSEILEA